MKNHIVYHKIKNIIDNLLSNLSENEICYFSEQLLCYLYVYLYQIPSGLIWKQTIIDIEFA